MDMDVKPNNETMVFFMATSIIQKNQEVLGN